MPMGINAYDYDFSHFSRINIWRNGNKYLPLHSKINHNYYLKNEECIKIFFAIDAIVCSRCSHQG